MWVGDNVTTMCPTIWTGTGSALGGTSCENCGRQVSPRYARVFGDNDDRIFGCPNCMSSSELRERRESRGYGTLSDGLGGQ